MSVGVCVADQTFLIAFQGRISVCVTRCFRDLRKKQSFADALSTVDNYHFYVQTEQLCGGMTAYLRSDIAGDRKIEFEFIDIETISIKIDIDNSKHLFIGAYL